MEQVWATLSALHHLKRPFNQHIMDFIIDFEQHVKAVQDIIKEPPYTITMKACHLIDKANLTKVKMAHYL